MKKLSDLIRSDMGIIQQVALLFNSAIACVLCVVLAGWSLESSAPPLTYFKADCKILNESMDPQREWKAGGTMYPYRHFKVERGALLRITRYIVDEDTKVEVHREPSFEMFWAKGEYRRTAPIVLPKWLKPGNYSYHLLMQTPLNPIRDDIEFEAPPMKFKIVP
jgi:hypothetical protein